MSRNDGDDARYGERVAERRSMRGWLTGKHNWEDSVLRRCQRQKHAKATGDVCPPRRIPKA